MNGGSTRVAAQLLARHPPKGFAAQVLAGIVVKGRILVHDASTSLGYGAGVAIGDCGGIGPLKADWPEIGRYAFQDPPKGVTAIPSDETLFLAALDPVYLQRSVSRTYHPNACGGFTWLNDAMRSHLVGTMLQGNPVSPFPEQIVEVEILFRTREEYRSRVEAFVAEQQANYALVAEELTRMGLLTEKERQETALQLQLSFSDARKKPAEDLPEIPVRAPVEWVTSF